LDTHWAAETDHLASQEVSQPCTPKNPGTRKDVNAHAATATPAAKSANPQWRHSSDRPEPPAVPVEEAGRLIQDHPRAKGPKVGITAVFR